MRRHLILCFSIFSTLTFVSGETSVTNAQRTIDIKSQLVKIKVEYELEGGDTFTHLMSDAEQKNVAHISFVIDGSDNALKYTTSVDKQNACTEYKVALPSNRPAKLIVEYWLTHVLTPFPAEISQSEQQYVLYEGDAYIYSKYPVKKQKSTIVLASAKVHSYTKVAPSKQDAETIVYGEYTAVEPYATKYIRVHSENNSPFLVVARLERLIELSHWGNIAVEENVEIEHRGAKLKGAFSRYDLQRDHRGERMPAVMAFKTLLPASSRHIYYRDEIGNISTSALSEGGDAIEMTIRPRFPLFGGWRTNYVLGYNVPSYEYLYTKGSHFGLQMRMLDHVFDNMVIEKLVVKVILPERVGNIKVDTPYKMKRLPDEKHYTFLDYAGRPVITLENENVVEKHIQNFAVFYDFDRATMLYEPLMVVGALYLVFLTVIILVRLDFTIAKDELAESRAKVQGLVERCTQLHLSRAAAYERWLDAVHKYRENKDSGSLQAKRKKCDGEAKVAANQIGDLLAEIKADSPECAEKLSEVQRVDKTLYDLMSKFHTDCERHVAGKMQKSAFVDAEKHFRAKYEECREKMDNIVYAL